MTKYSNASILLQVVNNNSLDNFWLDRVAIAVNGALCHNDDVQPLPIVTTLDQLAAQLSFPVDVCWPFWDKYKISLSDNASNLLDNKVFQYQRRKSSSSLPEPSSHNDDP